jgi:hypothetical protein
MDEKIETKKTFIQEHKTWLFMLLVTGVILGSLFIYNPNEFTDRWNNIQSDSLTPLKGGTDYSQAIAGVTITYTTDSKDIDEIKLNCDGIDIKSNSEGSFYQYGSDPSASVFKSNSDINDCELVAKDCIVRFCNEAKTIRDTPTISIPIQEDSVKLQEYKILLYETNKPIETIPIEEPPIEEEIITP